jgi:hypothetical protein
MVNLSLREYLEVMQLLLKVIELAKVSPLTSCPKRNTLACGLRSSIWSLALVSMPPVPQQGS